MMNLRIRTAIELRVKNALVEGNVEEAKEGLVELYDLDKDTGSIDTRTMELFYELSELEERIQVTELYGFNDTIVETEEELLVQLVR